MKTKHLLRAAASGLAATGLVSWALLALAPSAQALGCPTTAPCAQATPNSGLQDQQNIDVQGGNFPASTNIHIEECTAAATSPADCEGATDDSSALSNTSGSFDNTAYTVFKLPDSVVTSSSIKCDENNPCKLYVGTNPLDFSAPKTFVPISFAAATVPQSANLPLVPIGGASVLFAGGYGIWRKRRSSSRGSADAAL